MSYNKKVDEWIEQMKPVVFWNEGTEKQQEFADELIERFCKRMAKYLFWSFKDELITEDEIFRLTDAIYTQINQIDDAKWWCNKKNTSDITVAKKLLDDYENYKDFLKKMQKKYELYY